VKKCLDAAFDDIVYSYLNFFLTDPTQPVILQNPNWHDKLINIDLDNIGYGFNKIDIDTFRSHFGKPFVF